MKDRPVIIYQLNEKGKHHSPSGWKQYSEFWFHADQMWSYLAHSLTFFLFLTVNYYFFKDLILFKFVFLQFCRYDEMWVSNIFFFCIPFSFAGGATENVMFPKGVFHLSLDVITGALAFSHLLWFTVEDSELWEGTSGLSLAWPLFIHLHLFLTVSTSVTFESYDSVIKIIVIFLVSTLTELLQLSGCAYDHLIHITDFTERFCLFLGWCCLRDWLSCYSCLVVHMIISSTLLTLLKDFVCSWVDVVSETRHWRCNLFISFLFTWQSLFVDINDSCMVFCYCHGWEKENHYLVCSHCHAHV